MLKRYHHMVGGVFRAVDATVIAACWLAAYFIRFKLDLVPISKGLPSFETYAALTPLVLLLWAFVFEGLRIYQSRRMLRRTDEALMLLRAHGIALLLFIALTYLFSDYVYSRAVMITFGSLGAVSLLVFRIGLRNLLRQVRRRGYNLRHVLLIGDGPAIEFLVGRFDRFPELGLRAMGVLVPEGSKVAPNGRIGDVPVLGTLDELSTLLEKQRPDQLIVALRREHGSQLDALLARLHDEPIDLQLVPDIHEYIALGCEVEDFEGVPIVRLNDSPLEGWGALIKRATDFVLSAIALMVLLPVLTLISLAVKLTSKGPVFYSQERMGLDGKTFQMYKFRSMRVDAEKETGAVWAKAGDDRRTPIGSFLRSTSLDELPQFWNVLTGDMSLVGPRPERPVFVRSFRKQIPYYMLRHKVKAGITGWAQINGWRGNTSLERRIECDLYYIKNWSFLMDLKILFLTVWKGFINKNAY